MREQTAKTGGGGQAKALCTRHARGRGCVFVAIPDQRDWFQQRRPAYQACCSQPTLGPRRWRSGDEPEDWRKRERLKLPRDDSPSSSPTSSFTPRAQNVPRQHPRPLRYFVRSTAATPRYLRPTS
ncbi:uncharacterized protein CLUP02_18024 [Colletotrichum lupini]|uniref:Uncharacterized protein n=2 Tax=Colletotrichum acutatum species complex TaxID=2707335 RepID=A0A9Q8SGJ8_9PEZI|nr:uncharacterized protein CLUP02_18024 [Colletotrichum lupini]XP_060307802.1 uncharacterized protein CCOS01_13228 [Colletotrichum costaricense]KAK1515035.1 hypothetical protein CCOS01_13228 [Colletotrichum costaricense]UQC76511.1 hypothetical protein CLUP02_18024 [Colletotrichum lupini]